VSSSIGAMGKEAIDSERTARKLHIPVFLEEVLQYLAQPNARLIDGTLGDAGHAKELLSKSGAESELLGLDMDTEGLERAQKELEVFGNRAKVLHESFANIGSAAEKAGFHAPTGILFDLGMSTHHLQAERGFSFKNSGSLDMRFDPTGSLNLPNPSLVSLQRIARKHLAYSAADLLNLLHEDEIAEIIMQFGEERFAERIAEEVVAERRRGDFSTVTQLIPVIVKAYPAGARHGKIHVATKTFQALRIAVNREYETLEQGIKQALKILAPKGRLAIISFHSGEDRIVKQSFKKAAQTANYVLHTKHPIKPKFSEVRANNWSRSAKLRVIEKGNGE